MDTAIDLSDPSKALDLANIRFQLIRLEDSIIFHLIERAQFPLNPGVYDAEKFPIPCHNLAMPAKISLMDYMLSQTEICHSLVRRYESPDEHPFFPQVLQRPMIQPLQYPKILHPNDVNVNSVIREKYINDVLPEACRHFDRPDRGETKENYGSAAMCDVSCLQALSRRIHFGKFVAESKFQKDPELFVKLIKAEDRKGIDAAITDAKVEQKVLERLALKAKTYGIDPSIVAGHEADGKINIDAVVQMYAQIVIPMTKIVEVEYLMQRLIGTKWE